jgi:hypothetical protein
MLIDVGVNPFGSPAVLWRGSIRGDATVDGSFYSKDSPRKLKA